MKQNYLIFGSPGSGKGTLCQILNSRGYHIFAMGERLRFEVKAQTNLGREVKYHVDSGMLIGDDLAFAIISQEIIQMPRPFAIEGFPSTINQYRLFLMFLKERCLVENMTVVQLDCPEEKALERISGRMTCCECAFIYNRSFNPPAEEGRCDLCDGELFFRFEDTPVCAQNRIRTFNEKTLPILHLAKEDFPIVKINALQDVAEWAL